ncbi:unnamed protein product [Prorocentrum cordatum]|uniref:Uncharacterized protein n=1 Tax=Prorocentrum cordatum TaxID=2364126 RepID=A0ABN9UIZ4_9DINO|nr:unnamed protein product [Polarella glacialis]
MRLFFERSATLGTRTFDDDEAFTRLQMIYNMHAPQIPVINQNAYCEEQFNISKEHVRTEPQCQTKASEHVTQIADAIQCAGDTRARGVGNNPASEPSKMLSGGRAIFEDWSEKLLNPPAQFKHSYRTSFKYLNNELETRMGRYAITKRACGCISTNGMLTLNEYPEAAHTKQQEMLASSIYVLSPRAVFPEI